MGVLKVKQTDGSWRDVGCAPASTTGRLKLWTGSEWVVEKCDDTFTDDFDRADGAVANGWSVKSRNQATASPAWAISSGHAHCSTSTTTPRAEMNMLLRTGASADFTMSTTIGAETGSGFSPASLAFRVDVAADNGADGLSFWYVDSTRVFYLPSNSTTATTYTFSGGQVIVAGDVVTVTGSGDTITVFRNGTLIRTITSNANSTATAHGLASYGPPWRKFSFVDFTLSSAQTGHPLKALVGGVWTEVACMVPV